VLCPFRFNVVSAVAFDGVLADVDEFADDEERGSGVMFPLNVALPTRPLMGVERFWRFE